MNIKNIVMDYFVKPIVVSAYMMVTFSSCDDKPQNKDLNNDGINDKIWEETIKPANKKILYVELSNPDGTYQEPKVVAHTNIENQIEIKDVNKNGDLDIIIKEKITSSDGEDFIYKQTKILYNDGKGKFN